MSHKVYLILRSDARQITIFLSLQTRFNDFVAIRFSPYVGTLAFFAEVPYENNTLGITGSGIMTSLD